MLFARRVEAAAPGLMCHLAAGAMARTALGYEANPLEIKKILLGRFSAPLMETAQRANSRLPFTLRVENLLPNAPR